MGIGDFLGGKLRSFMDDWRSGGTAGFQDWLVGQVSQRLAGGVNGAAIRRGLQNGSIIIEGLEFTDATLEGNTLAVTIAGVDTMNTRAREYLNNFIGYEMKITVPDVHLDAAAIWCDAVNGDGSADEVIEEDD